MNLPRKSAVGLYLPNLEVDSFSWDLQCIVRVYLSPATGNAVVSQRFKKNGFRKEDKHGFGWNFLFPMLGIKPRTSSGLGMYSGLEPSKQF